MGMTIAMVSSSALLLTIASSLLCNSARAEASPCDDSFSFFGTSIARNITRCRRLRSLGAELGWSYYNATPNVTVHIVFSAVPPAADGWVAWGLNPGRRPQMVGTRALLAFLSANGTVAANTYNLTADTMHGCKLQPSPIEVAVADMAANYSGETGAITVSARLSLDPSTYDISKLKQVWQVGSHVLDQVPQRHPLKLHNLDSFEIIDLTSGRGFRNRGLMRQRVVHGVLSVIGWGIVLPVGVIIKRHSLLPIKLKKWNLDTKAEEQRQRKMLLWLKLHIWFQISAYAIGATAWAIGIELMSNSRHFKAFQAHRAIGILVFCLATLQITALCLKPKEKDGQNKSVTQRRKYWNIYHHFAGYALIGLSIANIFEGFAVLQLPSFCKWIYVGVLFVLACVAIGLEIANWAFKDK